MCVAHAGAPEDSEWEIAIGMRSSNCLKGTVRDPAAGSVSGLSLNILVPSPAGQQAPFSNAC